MNDTTLVWGLVRVILVLACLSPLVYLTARWYGKIQVTNRNLVVKERIPLGGNKTLYVVQWKHNQYLLGVTSQNMVLLDKQTLIPENQNDVVDQKGGE